MQERPQPRTKMEAGISLENDRLAALHLSGLLETQASEEFDQFTRLAADLFQVPTVLISLVDRDRQKFLARVGFDADMTPRESSICAYAMRQPKILEVHDLTRDQRFRDNALVTGSPFMRFYAGVPLRLPSGFILGALCIIDVKPRVLTPAEREQLFMLARMVEDQIALRQSVGRRDAVSGLVNRQQMSADLQDLIDAAQSPPQMLVLIDILDLKRAQEMAQAVGVSATESLICNIAFALTQALAGECVLYHVGVTRFAFWHDDDKCQRVVERVIRALEKPMLAAGVSILLRPHIGLAPFECAASSAGDVLRQAITALNMAREANTRCATYDAQQDDGLRRRYRLAVDIQRAFENDELRLVFQPRVAVKSGTIRSVEALLRWQHGLLGEISPAEFIPIVERTALMRKLTLWVIERAIRELKAWHEQFPALRLSINLSPRDFDDDDLVPAIMACCRQYRLDPGFLEFEVTEGEWLQRDTRVLAQMRALTDAGATLAIDDFGAGYSNFAYLNELPASILKIDQTLVRDIDRNHRHAILVRGILSIARRLGYTTVVEGVENAATAASIAAWKCDEAQGYFFARPMGAEQIASFIAQSGSASWAVGSNGTGAIDDT